MSILTCLFPTSGSASVAGLTCRRPHQSQALIGYPREHLPYTDMTVIGYLKLSSDRGSLRKNGRPPSIRSSSSLRPAASPPRDQEASRGYLKRVGIAQALLGDPPPLIRRATIGSTMQIISIRT
jgi:ABC-type multidrug transport system ATPase subunit